MKIKLVNLESDNKISCIKACRFAFGMGLRDAKDLVESKIDKLPAGCFFMTIEGELSTVAMMGMDKPPTVDQVRDYITLDNTNFLRRPHPFNGYGCGLSNVKVYEVNEKIETDGGQLFSVPNTLEGRKFLQGLHSYTNFPKFSLKKRGRGTRKDYGDASSIPLEHSEWIAVYVEEKSFSTNHLMGSVATANNALFVASNDLHAAQADNEDLKRRIAELEDTEAYNKKELDNLKHTLNELTLDKENLNVTVRELDNDKEALNAMIDRLEKKNKSQDATIEGLDVILKDVTTTPLGSDDQFDASIIIEGHTVKVSGATSISINK